MPLLALYGVPGRLGPGWPRWPSPVLGWRRRCPHYPWNLDTLGHLRLIYLAMVCVVSALLSGKGLLDARGTRPSRR